jgi:hypothetical protein
VTEDFKKIITLNIAQSNTDLNVIIQHDGMRKELKLSKKEKKRDYVCGNIAKQYSTRFNTSTFHNMATEFRRKNENA